MAARSAGRSRGIFKGFRRRLAPDAARSAKRASLYSSRSQLSLPIIAAKRPFVKKNRHFPGLAFRKTWRSSFLEAALPPRLPPKRVVRPSLCRRRLQPGDRAGCPANRSPGRAAVRGFASCNAASARRVCFSALPPGFPAQPAPLRSASPPFSHGGPSASRPVGFRVQAPGPRRKKKSGGA